MNSFSPNTKIKSADVNSNFTTLDSRTKSIFQKSGGGSNGISAAGGSAWTDITGETLTLVLTLQSTVWFHIHSSLQNSSAAKDAALQILCGSNPTDTASTYIPLTGVAWPEDSWVHISGLAAGTYAVKAQFSSSATTTSTSTNSGGNFFEVISIQPEV